MGIVCVLIRDLMLGFPARCLDLLFLAFVVLFIICCFGCLGFFHLDYFLVLQIVVFGSVFVLLLVVCFVAVFVAGLTLCFGRVVCVGLSFGFLVLGFGFLVWVWVSCVVICTCLCVTFGLFGIGLV